MCRAWFRNRIIDELTFEDGEGLKLLAFWYPYAKHPTVYRQTVTSTNTELLSNDWPTGSSLAADIQTKGRGRYDRTWQNTPNNLSCSWKISLPEGLSHGLTQVLLGNIVKNHLILLSRINKTQKFLKWPNDLIVTAGQDWGKSVRNSG